MGESQQHLALVDIVLRYAEWRLRGCSAVVVFADMPTVPRGERPPRVGGFVPDVFAIDVPTTVRIIGEAKTREDLERPHTDRQLTAFLECLGLLGGTLVLAVPWDATAAASRIAQRLRSATQAQNVEIVILDDTKVWHS